MKTADRKPFYRMLLCTVLVYISQSFVYSIPPLYISPYNGFCDENTSEDERIYTIADWSINWWPVFDIVYLEKLIQKVDIETISWSFLPFIYADGTQNWSDTWGMCAVLTDFGEMMDNIDGPDIINNQAEIDQWDNLTVSLAPTAVFRIIFVNEVNFDGVNQNPSFIGVTKPTAKMCIVESTVTNMEKLVMHERDHTNDCRVNPVGTYKWPSHPSTDPPFSYTHYSQPADFYQYNIMTSTIPVAGLDGDINFKFTDYPWIEPNWWDSKRWNENF